MASRVETPTQGLSEAQARPFTVETPMRMPVKEPGPWATAKISTLFRLSSAFFSMSSAMGSRVRLWVRPLHWLYWEIRSPSRTRATEAAFAEDSKARVSIFPPPLW